MGGISKTFFHSSAGFVPLFACIYLRIPTYIFMKRLFQIKLYQSRSSVLFGAERIDLSQHNTIALQFIVVMRLTFTEPFRQTHLLCEIP